MGAKVDTIMGCNVAPRTRLGEDPRVVLDEHLEAVLWHVEEILHAERPERAGYGARLLP